MLFRSNDYGHSWDVISPDLTTDDPEKQRDSGGEIYNDNTAAEFHTTILTVRRGGKVAMITTKAHPPWPGDCRIEKYRDAGLRVPCIVRLKLFTLDNRLLIRTLGRLTEADAARVQDFLRDSLI